MLDSLWSALQKLIVAYLRQKTDDSKSQKQGWQVAMLESLCNVGCNSTGRRILLEGVKIILSAKKGQSSSPVITDLVYGI